LSLAFGIGSYFIVATLINYKNGGIEIRLNDAGPARAAVWPGKE
jgi:hypothetical protein